MFSVLLGSLFSGVHLNRVEIIPHFVKYALLNEIKDHFSYATFSAFLNFLENIFVDKNDLKISSCASKDRAIP